MYFYNGYLRNLNFIFGIIYFKKHCTNDDSNSCITAILLDLYYLDFNLDLSFYILEEESRFNE